MLAKRWGVASEKVLQWIRTGELRAINAAGTQDGQRPRFLIDETDIATFEQHRTVNIAPIGPSRRRRKKQDVIEFF
jgi:hypothetical protein